MIAPTVLLWPTTSTVWPPCFRTATAGRPQHGTYRTDETERVSSGPRSMAAIGG